MIRDYLRERYFTDAKFHHVVNALAKMLTDGTITPNELDEALEVAKEKHYMELEAVDVRESLKKAHA